MDSLFNETRRHVIGRIADLIRKGGTRLPTDHELSSEITASYGTLRLVMNDLVREGFIRRIRGSGTYLTADAGRLLAESQRRRLQIFAPALSGDADWNFGCWLLESLQSQAETRNWRCGRTTVASHQEFAERLASASAGVDAVIYLPPAEPFPAAIIGELSECIDSRPMVVLDSDLSNVAINNVTTDNRGGGMLAATMLASRGHRQIAVVVSEPLMPQARARIRGFMDVMELSGGKVELIDCHVRTADQRETLVRKAMMARMALPHDFTAVFAISDAGALAVMRVLEELGIAVGRDMSLVGFDGIRAGETTSPVLSSVVQPVDEICRTALDWLEKPSASFRQCHLAPILRDGGTVCTVGAAGRIALPPMACMP